MKRIILGVTALLMFSACSNEDDAIITDAFESHIQVDGEAFTPSPNTAMFQNVITSFTEGQNNGEARVRTFHMVKASTSLATLETLQVSVIYPNAQSSINGTYSLSIEDVEVNRMAQGAYMVGITGYSFQAGNLTVTDLGNNKFRLEFDSVMAKNFMSDDEKTVTGYFEGTFEIAEE